MKALALAMLACVWCGVSAAQGERSAAEGYTAYWLTSKEPRAYEDLILARRPLSEMPRGAAAADTSLLTCEGVLVTTYQKDSIWNVDRRPFKPVAGVEKVLKDSITMNGREFRYAQADLRDVLRLLENPEGTIPIHRIYGPVSGQEDIALELARAIRRQLADGKSGTRLSPGQASTSPSLFFDYVEQPSREIAIRVNPDDLGGDWEKHPLFSWPGGRSVYVWTSGRTRKAVVDEVAVDRQSTRGRRIEIHVRSETDIPAGWILLSDKALPEQTWMRLAPSGADMQLARQLAERRIKETAMALKATKEPEVDRATYEFFDCSRVRTRLGEFLVVAFGTPEYGEFVTRRTVVFKADKGTWTQLYEDRDLGWELFVDVDGDGVPETVGGTGYNSLAVWKFYPRKSVTIMSSSGV